MCVPSRVAVLSGHEEQLNPYSVVQPMQVEAKRPVIFSPSLLSHGLIERLLQPAESGLKFNTCPPGTYTACELHLSHNAPNASKVKGDSSIDHRLTASYLCSVSFGLQSLSRLQRDETRECSYWSPAVQSRLLAYGCSQYKMSSAR